MRGSRHCRSALRIGAFMCLIWTWPATGVSRAAPAHVHTHTIFLIVMENHDWSSIAGSADAPYINHTLLRLGSLATRYYNPPGVHPSLPNYLWLEAGTDFGISDDNPPSSHMQSTHLHLTTLLTHAGISWRAYQQGISGQTCPLDNTGSYAVKHNPMVYFADVASRRSYCVVHERPEAQFVSDVRRNRVARYNFITPDLCHDMHDVCAPLNNAIRQGDAFLSTIIPTILRSSTYKRGGAIFITWDEGEGNDGPVGMIALSPSIRAGYRATGAFTHSSTLRTIEEIFTLRPLLGDAAHARDLRSMFRVFP